MRVRLPPTADRKKFKDSASGLFMDGGATVLSDGLLKAIGDQVAREFQVARTKYEVTFASALPPGSPVVVGVQRPGVKFEISQTRLR